MITKNEGNMNSGRKKIKFTEGQWFSVPLFRNKGYAIGLVARGGSQTGRGEFLGYYFGPRYLETPDGPLTNGNNPENIILQCWTSDQALITGDWNIIENGKQFIKTEWKVPNFYKDNLFDDQVGELITYDQDDPHFLFPVSVKLCKINEVNHLPETSLWGTDVVRSTLTEKLVPLSERWSK